MPQGIITFHGLRHQEGNTLCQMGFETTFYELI